MDFQEQSYGGKIFRPAPEVHIEDNGELIIIATPWGERSGARKVIDSIREFYLSANTDQEVTSPFQYITCISPSANHLRVSIMLANDLLFREENKNEYHSGVELFVGARAGQEMLWVQVGQPQIYLKRAQNVVTPLGGTLDFSLDFSESKVLPPLPSQLLGLESTSNFSVQSFRPQSSDQLLLLARSHPSPTLFSLQDFRLETVVGSLVEENPELAFWVGLLDIRS